MIPRGSAGWKKEKEPYLERHFELSFRYFWEEKKIKPCLLFLAKLCYANKRIILCKKIIPMRKNIQDCFITSLPHTPLVFLIWFFWSIKLVMRMSEKYCDKNNNNSSDDHQTLVVPTEVKRNPSRQSIMCKPQAYATPTIPWSVIWLFLFP